MNTQIKNMIESVKNGGLYEDQILIEDFMTAEMLDGFKTAYNDLWKSNNINEWLKNEEVGYGTMIKNEMEIMEFGEGYDSINFMNIWMLCDYLIPLFNKQYNLKGEK